MAMKIHHSNLWYAPKAELETRGVALFAYIRGG